MRVWLRRAWLAPVLVVLAAATVAAQEGMPLGTPIPGQPLGAELDDGPAPRSFLASQLAHPRVAAARDSADEALRALFDDRDVTYPAPEIFLRVFKHERIMELWARDDADSGFTLIREYPVCALPGQLGPKHQLGDFQVPEGFYFIDDFNPRSSHHLSLRVSYPNLADRMRGEVVELGGDIYVHGGCQTVGCVPIENDNIEEVYWLAAQAIDAGQRVIPIHIFPSRMDEASMRWLEQTFRPDPELLAFWRNLAEGYAYFQDTRRVPWITVARDGRYAVPPSSQLAGDEQAPADSAAEATAAPALVPVVDGIMGATAEPADTAAAADTAGAPSDTTGNGRPRGG